jgi:hypothetical protein
MADLLPFSYGMGLYRFRSDQRALSSSTAMRLAVF